MGSLPKQIIMLNHINSYDLSNYIEQIPENSDIVRDGDQILIY